MLELCGLKGHRIGGAVISPKHANFIENAGGATSADALALMAEARRRARERFGVELEHEVEFLGRARAAAAAVTIRRRERGRSRGWSHVARSGTESRQARDTLRSNSSRSVSVGAPGVPLGARWGWFRADGDGWGRRKRHPRGENGLVAGGRGSRTGSRPRARAATAVVPFRRNAPSRASRRGRAGPGSVRRAERAGGRLELDRIAPSGRSILAGLLILAAAVGAYAVARETSAFAVNEVAVEGAPPAVAADVREALKPALGESLLVVDLNRLQRAVKDVPLVASVGFDRAFPHTLRVRVVPEVPAAVLRQGARSWLAAASGKIVSELERGARPALPRLWLGRGVDIRVGERITGQPLAAVRAVAPLGARPLPIRVASVRATAKELTLVLRSGFEVRLGDGSDRDVKLEVARRILPLVGGTSGYLDVSVPQRAVSGATLNSQVEAEAQPSTTP